jgi:hypothetical protein
VKRREFITIVGGAATWGRAARLLALIAMLAMATSSLAQQNSPGALPSKKGTPSLPGKLFPEKSPGQITPQTITDRIESSCAKTQNAKYPSIEYAFAIGPGSVQQFEALARYSVLLLAVVTQNSEELPLKRAYLRTDRQIPLLKIASWLRSVDQNLILVQRHGSFMLAFMKATGPILLHPMS